jgi:hypothetical protein
LILSNDKRLHTTKALAALSKYLGCYDLWKDIVELFQLKWSNEDDAYVFHNITNVERFWFNDKWRKEAPQSCYHYMEISFYLMP